MVLTLQLGYIETLYWKNCGADGHLHLCEHTLVLVCRGQRRIVQPDNILLAISIHQFYLPQEFPQIFIILVYIHPKAKASAATEHVKNTMSESVSPDAPKFHIGDLNHCSLDEKLKGFDQYSGCSTWFGKTLDKCYGSIPNAYRAPLKALPTITAFCWLLLTYLSSRDQTYLLGTSNTGLQTVLTDYKAVLNRLTGIVYCARAILMSR